MDHGVARERAQELGGLAVGARRSPINGAWIIGAWSGTTWIVVSDDRRTVLDDGTGSDCEGCGRKRMMPEVRINEADDVERFCSKFCEVRNGLTA